MKIEKYNEFLKTKKHNFDNYGFNINREELNNKLFDYQKDLVKWALKKGKCALFTMTGTGKTFMQIEWAKQIYKKIGGKIIIFAPLAVNIQTKKEGEKFGVKINLAESQDDIIDGINITNYEKLHKFIPESFTAVILDESSILKNFSGKIKKKIIDSFMHTRYKLCCSATPAPNDFMELGNHAEFLNIMSRNEMLSMFFVNDTDSTQKWRLKGHGKKRFWEWIASWAAVLEKPSDLGYSDEKFILPDLVVSEITINKNIPIPGMLFSKMAETLSERREIRKITIKERCDIVAEKINKSEDIFLVWCDLNSESKYLKKVINNSVEIKGDDRSDYKSKKMIEFSEGKIKCLITKPSIAGFGMNWQICNKMFFVGLSDSFEKYFQAVRRCWRYGQQKKVDVFIVYATGEGNVIKNIKRKEDDSKKMINEIIFFTKKIVKKNVLNKLENKKIYIPKRYIFPEWLK